jgi:hypothetical protein
MATQTSDTVLNILQQVSDLRGESSTNTSAIRIRAVSNSERQFALSYPWRTHLLRDQTMVGSGVNDYTIGDANHPMRMKGLTEVFVDTTSTTTKCGEGSRYQVVDYTNYKLIVNNNSAAKVVYEWYDATNDLWKMHINGAPAATDTITYAYFWEPPTRTLVTDVVVCPDMDIIVHLTLAYLYKGEDEQKYQDYLLMAEDSMKELKSKEDQPAVGQLYQMASIENQSYPRGIGTY